MEIYEKRVMEFVQVCNSSHSMVRENKSQRCNNNNKPKIYICRKKK